MAEMAACRMLDLWLCKRKQTPFLRSPIATESVNQLKIENLKHSRILDSLIQAYGKKAVHCGK